MQLFSTELLNELDDESEKNLPKDWYAKWEIKETELVCTVGYSLPGNLETTYWMAARALRHDEVNDIRKFYTDLIAGTLEAACLEKTVS